MSKFVLIDHSLERLGGHHFAYAVEILRAAEAIGFQPVLACNRRFRQSAELSPKWNVHSLFRFDTYSRFALTDPKVSSQPTSSRDCGSRTTGWREWWYRWQRQRRAESFERACVRLFSRVSLRAGDQVFIPTLSELDLLGLVQYLKSHPDSRLADWHLQYHFHVFDGREPDYDRQTDRLELMRRAFAEALHEVPDHRLHFYTTSVQLSRQYNRLNVKGFRDLPYPVSELFHQQRREASPDRPLRVTCSGALRKEKGVASLADVARDLWADLLAPGKIQLVIQSNKRRFRLPLPIDTSRRGSNSAEPVVYAPFPLDPPQYVNLVCDADVGLLLYDSRRYYGRCSSVLVEMLCAGVPVIVPAGCWLAEQIAESIYCHLDRLPLQVPVIDVADCSEVVWRNATGIMVPRNQLAFGDSSSGIQGEVAVPAGATDLLLAFRWLRPAEPGTYVRLQAEQFDANGHTLGRSASIVGNRPSGAAVPILVSLKRGAVCVRFNWSNAYGDAQVTITDAQLKFLSAEAFPSGHCPAGAVGLIAADHGQVGDLLQNITDHYAHYRQSAIAFSHQWAKDHTPQRTVEELLISANRAIPQSRQSQAA